MSYLSADEQGFEIMRIIPSLLVFIILFILNSIKPPKRRPSDIAVKRYDPNSPDEKKKSALFQKWKQEHFDIEKQEEVIPIVVKKQKEESSISQTPFAEEDLHSSIPISPKIRKKREEFFSKLSYKKQLIVAHEIYSIPIALRSTNKQ